MTLHYFELTTSLFPSISQDNQQSIKETYVCHLSNIHHNYVKTNQLQGVQFCSGQIHLENEFCPYLYVM